MLEEVSRERAWHSCVRTIAFVWAIFIDVPVNNHFDTIIFIILYSWLRYLNKINLVTGGDASIWMSSYELTRRIAVLLHVAVDDEERACIWYGTVSICLYFLILFTIIITKELAACILHHSSMMHAEQWHKNLFNILLNPSGTSYWDKSLLNAVWQYRPFCVLTPESTTYGQFLL